MEPIARRLVIGAQPVWLTFDAVSTPPMSATLAPGYISTGLLRLLELGHILVLVCASLGVLALCAKTLSRHLKRSPCLYCYGKFLVQ